MLAFWEAEALLCLLGIRILLVVTQQEMTKGRVGLLVFGVGVGVGGADLILKHVRSALYMYSAGADRDGVTVQYGGTYFPARGVAHSPIQVAGKLNYLPHPIHPLPTSQFRLLGQQDSTASVLLYRELNIKYTSTPGTPSFNRGARSVDRVHKHH